MDQIEKTMNLLVRRIGTFDAYQHVFLIRKGSLPNLKHKGHVNRYVIVSEISKEEYEGCRMAQVHGRRETFGEVLKRLAIAEGTQEEIDPEKVFLGELWQFNHQGIGSYKLAYTPHDDTFFFYRTPMPFRRAIKPPNPDSTYEQMEKILTALIHRIGYNNFKAVVERINAKSQPEPEKG